MQINSPYSVVSNENIEVLMGLARTAPEGCFVEVGVYQGGTAHHLNKLAFKQDREFFAYDTFTGIPYKSNKDYHAVGDFADTSFEAVRDSLPNANVIQGVFPLSAVEMPPVAFAHIDCDQYQAIRESAEYLIPLMSHKGIMYFDDYGVPHLPASTQAVRDVFGDRIEVLANGKAIVRFDGYEKLIEDILQ